MSSSPSRDASRAFQASGPSAQQARIGRSSSRPKNHSQTAGSTLLAPGDFPDQKGKSPLPEEPVELPKALSVDDELVGGQPPSIWATYVKIAERYEGRIVERWNADMDALLIFAGLFTGVITAFVTVSVGDLSENYAQTSSQVLRALAAQYMNGTTASLEIPPVFNGPDPDTRFVNVVWFLAIVCSVGASTGAMLCKLWCTKFRNIYQPATFPDEYSVMACQMQSKFDAMSRWRMSTIVELLPGVLHIAVALFFLGLWKYLQAKDTVLGYIVGPAVTLVTIVYFLITIISLVSDAPFSTPFTTPLSFALKSISSLLRRVAELVWRTRPLGHILLALFPPLLLFSPVLSPVLENKGKMNEKNVEINALVWLLYVPLKYGDVCAVIKALLQLTRSGAVNFLDYNRLLGCTKNCLRSVMGEDGVVEGRHDLAFDCVRILALNRSSRNGPSPNLLENLPSSESFDKLFESCSGNTDKEVQLLTDSMWLLPSERRGQVAFRWANIHLGRSTLSDKVFADLIHDASRWLRNAYASNMIVPIPEVSFLEQAPLLSSITRIRIVLPYFTLLTSAHSPMATARDPELMTPSELLYNCLITLHGNMRPQWICKVIRTNWSDDPRSLDQSVVKALLDWVHSLRSDSWAHLSALLNAIVYGPKLLPTAINRPLTTLVGVLDSHLLTSDHKHKHISNLVQTYAAILENAFERSRADCFDHVKADFLTSFQMVSGCLTKEPDHPLCLLSAAFHSIVLRHPIQDAPKEALTLSHLFRRSLEWLDEPSNSQPVFLRWVCSIMRATWSKYPRHIDESIATTLVKSALISKGDSAEILLLKIEENQKTPKVLQIPTNLNFVIFT